MRRKVKSATLSKGSQKEDVDARYRLMWNDVKYKAGELKVVAFDEDGNAVDSTFVRTAGKPHHIELTTDCTALEKDGKDLAYVTVRVVDRNGNLCPLENRMLSFEVEGAGEFRAAANGDPTCLLPFHEPRMTTFNGMLTVILQSKAASTLDTVTLKVKSRGIAEGRIQIGCKR